jgi:hypothetical protein
MYTLPDSIKSSVIAKKILPIELLMKTGNLVAFLEISFQSHLENKRVSDGDSLKFHCSVQAEPSVSINWFHNAEMVPVNQTSRIYMYGEMSEYLVIEQVGIWLDHFQHLYDLSHGDFFWLKLEEIRNFKNK